MDDLKELIAKQRLIIEKNKICIRSRENILNNRIKRQQNNNSNMKSNTIVSELNELRHQYSDKKAELGVAMTRVQHLQTEIEQIRDRKRARNGCISKTRNNTLSEMRLLHTNIQEKSKETDRQLFELRLQKDGIRDRRAELKLKDDKINSIKQLHLASHAETDRKLTVKNNSISSNTINTNSAIKKMPLYTARPYSSGCEFKVASVKFSRNDLNKIDDSKNSIAEAQQTDPPLINNHKSKLRTLVESSRPSTKINNHDAAKLSVDGALSILLPEFKGTTNTDGKVKSFSNNTLQTYRENMSKLYKDYNINNAVSINKSIDEFPLLEDSVTSSVHNLTIEESHCDYSVEEESTTFDECNVSDSFDQSRDLNSNEDNEYSSNCEYIQIITNPPSIELKGCIRQENIENKKKYVKFDPLPLLLDASLEGELDVVKYCGDIIDDISATNDEGITALHNAICAGHFDIMRFLIDFPCDINAPDSDGWTPLHCAASCNHLPMLRLLVENGAAVLLRTYNDNQTALEKFEAHDVDYENCYRYLNDIETKLGMINRGIVYAVFNYESTNDDEISFLMNHKLQIITRGTTSEPHWWLAKNLITSKSGLVPCNLLGLYPRVAKKI